MRRLRLPSFCPSLARAARESPIRLNGTVCHDPLYFYGDLPAGNVDEAVTVFRKAIELKPNWAEAHCNLGSLLQLQGKFDQALVAWRRGHELGSKDPHWSYPTAGLVRECERFVELDGKLPALLRGQIAPADPAEELLFARCVQYKNLPGAAARFYRHALTAQAALADDLSAGHRLSAACAAARVGCGKGKDADQLDDAERARWRQQALEWLRADLTLWSKQLDSNKAYVQRRLRHWQRDADLAGLRDESALAKLPDAERQAWRQFWAEVQRILDQARHSPAAAGPLPKKPKEEGGP